MQQKGQQQQQQEMGTSPPAPHPVTLLRILTDIRTERCIRYSAIYMCTLSCFFYWSNRTQETPMGVFSVASTTYWSILVVMGCVPIGARAGVGGRPYRRGRRRRRGSRVDASRRGQEVLTVRVRQCQACQGRGGNCVRVPWEVG
jgi:hypothetical protein